MIHSTFSVTHVLSALFFFPLLLLLFAPGFSGGDRTDEQPVPAEAEGADDGCHEGGGAQPAA